VRSERGGKLDLLKHRCTSASDFQWWGCMHPSFLPGLQWLGSGGDSSLRGDKGLGIDKSKVAMVCASFGLVTGTPRLEMLATQTDQACFDLFFD
jgi:hypothetical protein